MEDRIKILLFFVIFLGRMLHYGWIFLCAKCPVVLLDHVAWGAIIDIWFLFCFYCMLFRLEEVYEFLEMFPKIFKWNFWCSALFGWFMAAFVINLSCRCENGYLCR